MSLKALVAVKRVCDYAVKIRVRPDKTGVELGNVKMSMNPFCEIACEEAVRMREKGMIKEVVALSVGPKACQETLRTALAMGADRGVLVETDLRGDTDLQPLCVSKVLAAICKKENPLVVLLGKQAIDSDNGQVAQMLAAMMKWSLGTFASKITLSQDKKFVIVQREVDNGVQTIKCSLPSVLSTDLRLNEPRFATLPNIMKARKKTIEVIPIASLGIDPKPHMKILSVEEPAARKAGVKVESVQQLVDILKQKGFVKA
eukprot:TRINITY_DN5489_c0_g1_i1.p1 TRINITY_DN5489_c0_g1~~TRINITY_DN5489_c0_g1_i1.p1  ORF type:complete len:259 (-),score=68.20 TRINITY_DN5489_c0_g1_i1:65-841(-)